VLKVLDNGIGMTALRDLFRLGETVGRKPQDIGEYGCGGTMALLYLASEVRIWTLKDGAVATGFLKWQDYFDADDFPEMPTLWKRPTTQNTPESLMRNGHGTLIELKILRHRKLVESNVRRELSALYAPAVRNGCVLQWVTAGQLPIALADPLEHLENSINFDFTLQVPTATHGDLFLRASGVVGTVKDLPIERSRVAVSFHHRVIKWTRECYAHSSGRAYQGVGLCGWLHLDDSWQGLFTTTKDAIDNGDAWVALTDAIFLKIEPLLKHLQHEKQTLLLEGIALELQEMLSTGAPTPVLYGEPSEDGVVVGPGNLEHGNGGGGGGGGKSRGPRLHGDHEGGESKAVSKLEITYMSDAEMRGCLSKCTVDFFGKTTAVSAFINKEHTVIQVALEQHPVNRMALALVVAQSVAYQVCIHADILKMWFGRRYAEHIECAMDSEERGPFVLRLLMDRFRFQNTTTKH